MQNIISSIAIQFGLNNAQLKQNLQQTDQIFAQWRDGFLRQIVAPIAAALSVKNLFQDYYTQSLELGEVAKRARVAMQDLQAYGGALREVGGDVNNFTSTIANLRKQQEALFTPGGGQRNVFTMLGIDPNEARNMNLIDLLMRIGEGAKRGLSPEMGRNLMRQLGIDEYTIEMLQKSTQEFQKLAEEEAKRISVTEKDYKMMLDFRKSVKDLRSELQGLANAAFRPLMPLLTEFAEKLADGIRFLKEHPPLLYAVVGALTALSGILSARLVSNIGAVALALMTRLVPALGATSAAAAPLTLTILPIIAAVTALALALDDLYAYATGGRNLLGNSLWKYLGTPEEIQAWAASAKSSISSVIDWGTKVAKDGAAAFKKYYGDVGEDIGSFFRGLMVTIRGIITGDVDAFLDGLSRMVYAFGDGIVTAITGFFKNIADVGLEIWRRLTGTIEDEETQEQVEEENFSTDLLNPSRIGRRKHYKSTLPEEGAPPDIEGFREIAEETRAWGDDYIERAKSPRGRRNTSPDSTKRDKVEAIIKDDPERPADIYADRRYRDTQRPQTTARGINTPINETYGLMTALLEAVRVGRTDETLIASAATPLENRLVQDMRQMSISIGKIDIQTEATDAEGIGRDLGATLYDRFGAFLGLVDRSMTGTIEKGGVGY